MQGCCNDIHHTHPPNICKQIDSPMRQRINDCDSSITIKDTSEKDGDKVENASRKRKAANNIIMTDDDKSGGRELGLEVAGAATRRGMRNTNK